jgi:hypothetical protein
MAKTHGCISQLSQSEYLEEHTTFEEAVSVGLAELEQSFRVVLIGKVESLMAPLSRTHLRISEVPLLSKPTLEACQGSTLLSAGGTSQNAFQRAWIRLLHWMTGVHVARGVFQSIDRFVVDPARQAHLTRLNTSYPRKDTDVLVVLLSHSRTH